MGLAIHDLRYNSSKVRKLLLFIFFFLMGAAIAVALSLEIARKRINIPLPVPTPKESVQSFDTYSVNDAPKDSVRGQIATMSGEIRWTSRTATEAAILTKPITIQQGEDLETGITGNLDITFPNTSSVKVFPESKVSIVQTLPSNFLFAQNKGEIEYEKVGNTPVSIRILSLLSEINGKALIYIPGNSPYIYLTVEDGTARGAYKDVNGITQVIELKKGQRFIFNDDRMIGVIR